jgi:hypothetical protein
MFHNRLRHLIPALFISGLIVLPGDLSAQNKPCEGEVPRQFDFWVGTWRVENPAGAVVGHNTITRVTDCFLHESYTTPTGYEGQSFNIYDAARGVWHQSWVDNGGLLLQLDGGLDGGKMILQGPGVGQGGVAVINRITWSVEGGDPDHIRQLWETSTDDGETWSVGFDGHYTREAEGS